MNKKITTPENERDMDSLKEEFSKLFQEWDTKLKDVNLDEIDRYMDIVNKFMDVDGWVPERDGKTMEWEMRIVMKVSTKIINNPK